MKKLLSLLGVAILIFSVAGTANALLVDFEDIAVSSGTYTTDGDLTSNGFLFDSSTNHLHRANDASLFESFNGTTWLGIDNYAGTNSVGMDDGSTFSLQGLDIGEFHVVNGLASTVRVTGYFSGGGSIFTDIIIDMIYDGAGPGNDFQTVYFSSSWANLTSVSFAAIAGVGDRGFTLDNIAVNNPVPEPATILLLGSGLVGLVGFRRKFKK